MHTVVMFYRKNKATLWWIEKKEHWLPTWTGIKLYHGGNWKVSETHIQPMKERLERCEEIANVIHQ